MLIYLIAIIIATFIKYSRTVIDLAGRRILTIQDSKA